jgi:hypothetical protein
MKGEYTGADGRRFIVDHIRVTSDKPAPGQLYGTGSIHYLRPGDPDLPLAVAALAEMKYGGECIDLGDGWALRFWDKDRLRWDLDKDGEIWGQEVGASLVLAAFRAGRSVALESVKELAEAVLEVDRQHTAGLGDTTVSVSRLHWQHIVALAKAVK